MHVFIIPSWYPSKSSPLSGCFVKEQALAISHFLPDVRVTVSTWGHEDGLLPLKQLQSWLGILSWRLRQKPDQINCSEIHEIFNPLLTWSDRLPFRGLGRLVAVNQRNLEIATKAFGKVDLMHAHVSYPAGYVASVLKETFGIPYVLTEHMGPFPHPALIRRGHLITPVRTAFNRADATVAVSPFLANAITKFGFDQCTVIPNLVNEQQFRPQVPTPGRFVLFTLCTLTPEKGVEDLLRAFAQWNPLPKMVELRIGGDGPMADQYRDLAQQLGIADRIFWLGRVGREHVVRLFQTCHVYVMPSRYETFGVVYAEAMACGKPVIATQCGGPESIVNQDSGRLVEVGNIDQLAEVMEWMYGNWSNFDPKSIRTYFENNFSGRAVTGQLFELYKYVIRGTV